MRNGMKKRVWSIKAIEECDVPDAIQWFRLVQLEGGLTMAVVDVEGEPVPQGKLVTLTHEGNLRRHPYIGKHLQLELTGRGGFVRCERY